MSEQVLFWQVWIKITQSPHPFIPIEKKDNYVPDYQEVENFRSFLVDLFGCSKHLTYGLEITLNKRVELTFFTIAISESEAIEIGQTWLTYLKINFKGLDGFFEILTINENLINKWANYEILEIYLPDGLTNYKINIIEQFINLFFLNSNYTVKLYLYWQRESSSESNEEQSNLYYIRIFLAYEKQDLKSNELIRLNGILKFLCINIETTKGKRANLAKCLDITIYKLLIADIFNNSDKLTNIFTKKEVIFDFPDTLPLPKLPILDYENIRYIDKT